LTQISILLTERSPLHAFGNACVMPTPIACVGQASVGVRIMVVPLRGSLL
jgi:hypothetical protein